MWACNNHLKETLTLLETPHISKAPYQIKCSLCGDNAVAKIYYAHKPIKFRKNHSLYPLIANS